MSVSVRIPTILRTYTGGESEVSAQGQTLTEILDDLDSNYSGIKGRIVDEKGELRRFVNVYVGNDDVRFLENLETATPDGTQISVIPAVAGWLLGVSTTSRRRSIRSDLSFFGDPGQTGPVLNSLSPARRRFVAGTVGLVVLVAAVVGGTAAVRAVQGRGPDVTPGGAGRAAAGPARPRVRRGHRRPRATRRGAAGAGPRRDDRQPRR